MLAFLLGALFGIALVYVFFYLPLIAVIACAVVAVVFVRSLVVAIREEIGNGR